MAIINDNLPSNKEKIKVEIRSDILQKIQHYCNWAGIYDLGYFIEETAQLIFLKDKAWQKRQSDLKKLSDDSI